MDLSHLDLLSEEGMSLWTTSIPANSTAAINEAKNITNNAGCSGVQTKDWVITVVLVYLLFIIVLGIVLNLFVLMVFCLHKKPCTVAEIYLSNLAAADLILVSCLPFWAVTLSKGYNWIFGRFLCKVVNLGIKMNACCSIYFLVLVSIDRYLALVHTMSQNRMRRPKFAKLGCVLVWVFCLLLSVPTLIYREVQPECNGAACQLHMTPFEYRLHEGIIALFSFIIPIPILSFCTFKIIQALNNRSVEGLNGHRTEHKATTLVLAVLVAFLICWVPFHVVRIVEILMRANVLPFDETNVQSLDTWSQIVMNLAYFNSVLNPILYVVVGQNFRKKVKELFKQFNHERTTTMTSLRSNVMRSVKREDS